jgi:hypothetical protein
MAFTNTKAFMNSVKFLSFWDNRISGDSVNAAELKTVNFRASKDFRERFGSATEEKWFAIPGGYTTYFKIDGLGGRAFYDKKGRWQGSMTNFGEDKLPKDIRAVVRSAYYDYAITLAQDIETTSGGVYVIHLAAEKYIKIVRVTKDGDMDVLQEFEKTN